MKLKRPTLVRWRYRWLLLLTLTSSLFLVGQNELPNATAPVPGTGDTTDQFEDQLANWWRDYKAAKQMGDRESQEKAYKNFLELKRSDQSEIFELGAYLFLEEGFEDLSLQKFDSARKEFHQALELNPYLWPARLGLAKIKKTRDSDVGRFVHLNYEGLTRAFNPRNTYFLFDAMIWFLNNILRMVLGIFVFLVFIFLVKYGRSFYYTTEGACEHLGMKRTYAQLATMVILLLPLLLGLNLILVAGLYLAMIFPFLEGSEKQVGLSALLSWLVIPLLLLGISNINFSRANPILRAHLSQYYQGDAVSQIERLNTLSTSGELGNRTKMLVGKFFKRNGQLGEAVSVYATIPNSSRHYDQAQINMANIHVLGKEYQQAIGIYKRITGEKTTAGLALYNLSIVKAVLGSHEEAESFRSQAFKVSPELISKVGLFENVDERFLLDAEPDPVNRVWGAIFGDANPVQKSWHSRPSLIFMGIASIVLSILCWVLLRLRNMRALAKPCTKCGMVFFISDSPNSEWCSQCVSLYIRKEDLPSDAKIKKSEQVQRYSKTKRWVVNALQVLVPGSKQMFRGHSWVGFFTLCMWVVLLVMAVYPIDQIQHSFMHYFEWPSFWTYLSIGVAGVFWLIFGVRGIWQED